MVSVVEVICLASEHQGRRNRAEIQSTILHIDQKVILEDSEDVYLSVLASQKHYGCVTGIQGL